MANFNSIQAFKKGFNGGTRSNRFEVISISGWPSGSGVSDTTKFKFKMHATAMPKSDLGQIGVGYRGRFFKIGRAHV